MTPSTKKVCIYGLITALGEKTFNESKDDQIKTHAKMLIDFGKIAVMTCHAKVDNNKIKAAGKKIYEACHGTNLKVVEMLSFLFYGLHDLARHSKNNTLNDILLKRISAFIRYFGESDNVYELTDSKYMEWIK